MQTSYSKAGIKQEGYRIVSKGSVCNWKVLCLQEHLVPWCLVTQELKKPVTAVLGQSSCAEKLSWL